MSIDVNGCVYLNNYDIKFIPLKFNYVRGGFY